MIRFAVVDVETTGAGANDDMIQVGLALVENGQIIQTYSSFVRPRQPIPGFIQQLTGITNDMVADAPDLASVCRELHPMLDGAVLLGHNIGFDLGFLQRSFEQTGMPPFSGRVLDTLDMTRILFPGLTSYQLGMICEAFGIPLENAHRADADAEATAYVWLVCLQRLASLPLLLLQRIQEAVQVLFLNPPAQGADLGWFLDQVIEEKIRLEAEGHVLTDPESYRMHRQFVLGVDDWTAPVEPESQDDEHAAPQNDSDPFSPFLEQLYERIRGTLDSYEERPSQRQMIQEVWEAMRTNRHLVVEAGTGTGKSLAYMIPSLYFGLLNRKKVIVSTHTVQLQEQLRQRDVPFLQSVFPLPFEAAVLKGRNHYLCLRKFEHKINTRDYETMKDDAVAAAQMLVWLSETQTGDENEITWGNRGQEFWGSVASDSDSCLNRSCPWFKKCFYHRAKATAQKSDLLITNHSLLMTDFMTEHRLLPAYQHVVIDEAHHFEDVASKHLGLELTYFGMLSRMYRIYKDGRSGHISQLKQVLSRSGHVRRQEWIGALDTWAEEWLLRKEEWDHCAEMLFQIAASVRPDGQSETPSYQCRLKVHHPPKNWKMFQLVEQPFYEQIGSALRKLEALTTEMTEDEASIPFDVQGVITDMGGSVKQLMRLREGLHVFAQLSDPNFVYWIEANAQYTSRSIHLYAMPVDVSEPVQDLLFKTKSSVVMTSATLSVSNQFNHFCEPLGLPAPDTERLRAVQLPSPFNYDQQALVCIPTDFPMVKGTGSDFGFTSRLVDSLVEVAAETGGRMLVLFTSYKMLRAVYGPLKSQLSHHQIQVIGQGVDTNNRTKLTRWFKDQERVVLLGTSSFWEGVDIPGDSLTCLAIVKLPFQPPNHPVVEAKSEFLEKQRKNPFMAYSVPQAVIRFKQGFGRLVRCATDRGIVILYDTRVEHTRYGKYFLDSLPNPRIDRMKTDEMVKRIRAWLQHKEV